MAAVLRFAGFEISYAALIALAALFQLTVIGAISAFSKAKKPKKGLRRSELALVAGGVVFVLAMTIAHMATAPKAAATPVAQAAVVAPRKSHGSCNSIRRDMLLPTVEQNLGKADEVRLDEETRGPGAVVWIYRDSRCAVHVFDNKVEFVE